ncbi:adaptin ear-binding coat-associated protein 1 [Umbelopsis sp. PMI_123]|nr:adaptin ear-binding coat-associated protein 1 [Umbelopsis sp. PMI_123]
MDDDYESVLLIVRECYVYKIPPRTTARGYRAAEWGDMQAFLWKGRLRIIAQGKKCSIRLEDSATGDLFAICPYDPDDTSSVEPVLDSSRYFVLRIESEGRHAFVGMGFLERGEAFDFNVALQDFVKQINAEKEAATKPKEDEASKKDYSLKEGETISINIGKAGTRRTRPKAAGQDSGSANPVPFLPPPPSAAQVKRQQQQTKY